MNTYQKLNWQLLKSSIKSMDYETALISLRIFVLYSSMNDYREYI